MIKVHFLLFTWNRLHGLTFPHGCLIVALMFTSICCNRHPHCSRNILCVISIMHHKNLKWVLRGIHLGIEVVGRRATAGREGDRWRVIWLDEAFASLSSRCDFIKYMCSSRWCLSSASSPRVCQEMINAQLQGNGFYERWLDERWIMREKEESLRARS